ncbi:MAG TPA: hypothetical protein PLS10_08555 [Chitinophagales bacterium]|nr:hypothetical protein [Chitinophagales bacterium]
MKTNGNKQEKLLALEQAVNKIAENFLPSNKEDATFFWTTLKFSEAIEQICGTSYKDSEIIKQLENKGYQNSYMENIGLVWWVKVNE